MKIDLHVHTRERSACARSSEDEQIQAAMAAGLDGIFITDHGRLVPPQRIEALRQAYAPFLVFGGIEINTQSEHILVLGVHDPLLEREDWFYADLHACVRSQRGFMALAHPYRYNPSINVDLERYPVDGIEVHSANTPQSAEADIRSLSARLGIHLLSNSDAHTSASLGKHFNRLPGSTGIESELIALLKAGQIQTVPE